MASGSLLFAFVVTTRGYYTRVIGSQKRFVACLDLYHRLSRGLCRGSRTAQRLLFAWQDCRPPSVQSELPISDSRHWWRLTCFFVGLSICFCYDRPCFCLGKHLIYLCAH